MIHTDFERGFIRAEVIHWDELLEHRARGPRPATSASSASRARTTRSRTATSWSSASTCRTADRCPGWCATARCWPPSRWPTTRRARAAGLLGPRRHRRRALLLRRPGRCTRSACASPIDVAFCDGDLRVLRIGHHAPATGRPAGAEGPRAVIEAEAGPSRAGSCGPATSSRSESGDRERGAAACWSGTPIGNLGDLSPRAVEELARADVVACEDTPPHRPAAAARRRRAPRAAGRQRPHRGPAGRATSSPGSARGERVAVVTDAGMPGISDPGERLVRAAAAAGHGVEVVPGPVGRVAALVASAACPPAGSCSRASCPARARAAPQRLAELAGERRTHRALRGAPPPRPHPRRPGRPCSAADRRVAVARELTKLHEEVWRGLLHEPWPGPKRRPRGRVRPGRAGRAPAGPARPPTTSRRAGPPRRRRQRPGRGRDGRRRPRRPQAPGLRGRQPPQLKDGVVGRVRHSPWSTPPSRSAVGCEAIPVGFRQSLPRDIVIRPGMTTRRGIPAPDDRQPVPTPLPCLDCPSPMGRVPSSCQTPCS